MKASSPRWAWLAVGLTLVAIVVAILAVRALDDDDSSADSSAMRDAPSAGALEGSLRETSAASAPFTGLTTVRLAVDGDCLHLVVADTLTERVQGLRSKRDASPYDGMLFVFDELSTSGFTMSGVPAALGIGFYDAEGTPVSRQTMQPCDKAESECPVYHSDTPFLYALETGAGRLQAGALTPCPS